MFELYVLRKPFITTLLLCLNCFLLDAQTNTDSTKPAQKSCENYYAPFHLTIVPFHLTLKDTAKKETVSPFGHYFSVGIGRESDGTIAGGVVRLISYSLAYKSHLFTVTRGDGGNIRGDAYYQQASYIGLLLGETVRFKHFMVSLSKGIAFSHTLIIDSIQGVRHIVEQRTVSFPVELKAFLLARNGIGIGIHISENIVHKYSSFYFGASIVFGKWNKPKKVNT